MAPITARWEKLASFDSLRRSSHILSAHDSNLFIFSGELAPRQPVDNHVYILNTSQDKPTLSNSPATTTSPPPRVGAAATTLPTGETYLFSGRGGPDMTPLAEDGVLWVYSPASQSWTPLSPASDTAPRPAPRSYHCMTSSSSGGSATIYLHAGCPAQGRLSDLWAFSPTSRAWRELPPSPGPPRGGASIAAARGKLYRLGGFDGSRELGGSLDVYDPVADAWTARRFEADGIAGPEPRSVGALLAVQVGGRDGLVVLFGEREPSGKGHQGAGRMWDDVWFYDLEDEAWARVEVEARQDRPCARGWFAAGVWRCGGQDRIVVHGGLGESNERLGDVWILSF